FPHPVTVRGRVQVGGIVSVPVSRRPSRRRPRNLAEGEFFDAAQEAGFDVCKRGWPDFIIEKDGQLYAVEVKPDTRFPTFDQKRVTRGWGSYGVPVLVGTPGGGSRRER